MSKIRLFRKTGSKKHKKNDCEHNGLNFKKWLKIYGKEKKNFFNGKYFRFSNFGHF